LRAAQVVGVVVADGCSLEILPKIDFPKEEGEPSFGRIRRRLVHMLAVVLDLEIAAGAMTDLGWQRENLLEILIGLFASKLSDAVRQGMPLRYVGCEEDLPILRGRLDVTRQFTTLAARPQALACRYDALSPDIALNRIMKAAVSLLTGITRSAANQRRLRESAFACADIAEVPRFALRWDEVVLDRTNARWRELVSLARLLLGQRFQTTSDGGGRGFSLLFEMNTLFEEYVARMLARALQGTALTVHPQGGRRFCLEEIDSGVQRFMTKPDILIKRGQKVELIIDTKWKRLNGRIDDPKQGISQGDVYQMMAYGRLYGCAELMLLYPHHAALGCPEGTLTRLRIQGSADHLSTATIDLSTAENLAARLRARAAAT
jgi:5-methylcytosine-specific restriction enzyme subunit McrC